MNNAPTLHCKNCGEPVSSRFCGQCGQKADTHRITWHDLEHQFRHALLHVDQGILYTIKELATRPGHSTREFLLGKRKSHYNPFLLLIITAGLCSLLYTHFHLQTVFAGARLDKLEISNAAIAHKFFAIRTVFFCLLFATGDTLLFKKRGNSFPEMILVNAFALCGVSIIQIMFVPLLVLGERYGFAQWIRPALVLAVLAYLWWMRRQFYEAKTNKPSRWAIPLSLLLYLAVIALVGMVLVPYLMDKL